MEKSLAHSIILACLAIYEKLGGDLMGFIFKFFKSKTVDVNAAAAGVVGLLAYFGFEIPMEVVAAAFTILNWVLRLFTKEPISAK